MLTYRGLVELARTLGDQSVLSIYVNGEMDDPARRRRWRIELRNALDEVESWLRESGHAVREDFAARRALVEARLEKFGASVRAPGWVGFYTSTGEFEAGPLPVAVPTMAIWSTGPCLAPYMRVMKEARPVVVLVADHAAVRLYRYVGRQTEPVEVIRARQRPEQPPHASRPPRVGFHQGTRGPTATDEAQRELQAATERLLHDLNGRLTRHVGDDPWLVLGGIPSMASALQASLPAALAARSIRARSLDVHATRAQVGDAAREGATLLRNAEDLRQVNDALGRVDSDRRGVRGAQETLEALRAGQVRDLYFTDAFLQAHAVEAEDAVRLALRGQAFIEQVSGEAAERLDALGGVAARLRYPAPAVAPEEPAHLAVGAAAG